MAGFDFGNHLRNSYLGQRNVHLPKATSTGTTIVGCLFDGGVVIGADTRATEGSIVADKNCEKIHFISDNIRCAGAGTAADTEFTTALISSNIALHALSTGRKPLVVTAMTMLKQMLFRYQGQVGAALVLGGVDATGSHLYTVAPHGSTDKLPYVTMGSGSLAAMAVFESAWKPNMTRQVALELVCEAIEAGIFNDLGSGSNVDACIIEAKGTEMLRNYRMPNQKVDKERSYKWRRGTTAYTKEEVKYHLVKEEVTIVAGGKVAGPEGTGAAAGMEVDA
ncbi:proteasome subunit beta type-7 [Microbotryum lychnidis-dioicae p1A1 Lamole]|uniref:proteasome endopeptidase complex n=1 Tax=Microbotryum lychnidis-dioicae (strain p1A1 Lamole / MvSl-1064) TaxID=683840 RepID=U5HBA4_USTV1|nr:proteasome subunit beta type-7 [Microbotryum lychnidis-dioicae p1A1 Lamole]|eukprot:KDE05115.1 proteasome subunit beta type-7 [Microbotryum lychnidis-dioicae p1A1 Lamole]